MVMLSPAIKMRKVEVGSGIAFPTISKLSISNSSFPSKSLIMISICEALSKAEPSEIKPVSPNWFSGSIGSKSKNSISMLLSSSGRNQAPLGPVIR